MHTFDKDGSLDRSRNEGQLVPFLLGMLGAAVLLALVWVMFF